MHLYRIDHNRNMARFYSMQVQRTLFGEWTLLREWGRIGTVRSRLSRRRQKPQPLWPRAPTQKSGEAIAIR